MRDERQMELETEEMKVELESSIEGVEMNRERQKVCYASFIVFIVLATLYNGSLLMTQGNA